jgi:2-dehydropantoate 2-reductase
MKIAVVGCGAVGSYYGARLARDGHELHFLLRSDYETVRRNGVCIRSPQGDFQVRPRCARTPQEIGRSDLVLIGLKTTANDQFPTLLPPLVDSTTAVMTLQNGLGNEEQLARIFPAEQIMGGLCFVCLNRLEPGVIHHLDHGLVMLGEFQRWPEPRTHDIATMFRHAGIPCKVAANFAQAHWEKLVWNIPFNGLGVAGVAGFEAFESPSLAAPKSDEGGVAAPKLPGEGGVALRSAFDEGGSSKLPSTLTTDKLLGDPLWEKLVRELMLEVISAARALGYDLPDSLADKQIERTRTMGPYKASTLLDFENGLPLELDSLFLEPLRQAKQSGASVPHLESLCRVLQELNPGR